MLLAQLCWRVKAQNNDVLPQHSFITQSSKLHSASVLARDDDVDRSSRACWKPGWGVAAQTVQELYKVSRDEEALALMADIASSISSMDTPAYPGR